MAKEEEGSEGGNGASAQSLPSSIEFLEMVINWSPLSKVGLIVP